MYHRVAVVLVVLVVVRARQELRCAREHGTRGIIEGPLVVWLLATVWLIDVVANKFGVIGWRVYRDARRAASCLGLARFARFYGN